MKNNNLYEQLFFKLYNAVDWMMKNYEQKDSNRNRVNYGSATAYACILREMGHDVELRVYEKEGYLVTDKITIKGADYDFFHS